MPVLLAIFGLLSMPAFLIGIVGAVVAKVRGTDTYKWRSVMAVSFAVFWVCILAYPSNSPRQDTAIGDNNRLNGNGHALTDVTTPIKHRVEDLKTLKSSIDERRKAKRQAIIAQRVENLSLLAQHAKEKANKRAEWLEVKRQRQREAALAAKQAEEARKRDEAERKAAEGKAKQEEAERIAAEEAARKEEEARIAAEEAARREQEEAARREAESRARQEAANQRTVYITETGECYHFDPNCYGLRNARRLIESTYGAASQNHRPCKLCAQ